LKKSFFQSSKAYLKNWFELYQDKSVQDDQGQTLAHHCIRLGCYEYLPRLIALWDIPNHDKVTPRELLDFLDITPETGSERPLTVYRRKEQRFEEFSQDDILKHFKFRYIEGLKFQKYEYLQWIRNRCHKTFLQEELKKHNLWKQCLYKSRVCKTYVKWVSPLVGYGLFAKEDIPAYSCIGEYVGLVRKRKRSLDKYNDYIFGCVIAYEDTPFVIDAQERGNHTRFINHSDTPNLRSTWLMQEGICHIMLVTEQKIPQDTQLTYDYGADYWKKRTEPFELS